MVTVSYDQAHPPRSASRLIAVSRETVFVIEQITPISFWLANRPVIWRNLADSAYNGT